MPGNEWRGIALVCDRQGTIIEVVSDEGNIASASGRPANSMAELLDAASVGKYELFFDALRTGGKAFDWLMSVRVGESLEPLHFAGVAQGQHDWIVAARDRAGIETLFDELAAICASSPEERQAAKSRLHLEFSRGGSQDELLDEMSRLNNELANLHREVAKKNVELERANQELSEYNHFVAHDIRAPLRAIRSYATFLSQDLDGTLPAEQQRYLDGLRKAADWASVLVQDLGRLTQIDRESLNTTSVDVGQLVHDIFDSIRSTQPAELVLGEKLPTIISDSSLLRHLFENLLTNAVKFNRNEVPRVEVGVERNLEKGSIQFFVRDDGIGIDPQYHERIFATFERLHAAEEFEGTGIGLAIVRRIAAKLGGQISIESKLDQGSTFFVSLPVEGN